MYRYNSNRNNLNLFRSFGCTNDWSHIGAGANFHGITNMQNLRCNSIFNVDCGCYSSSSRNGAAVGYGVANGITFLLGNAFNWVLSKIF